jgi:hypothetical protein
MNEFEVLGIAVYATLITIAFDFYKKQKRRWGENEK